MATVLAVVSNFARPDNVEPICRRLCAQPCDVIVADNAPHVDLESYKQWYDAGVQDIWSWRTNSGPPARWYPACAFMHQYRYLMFVDDDFLPRDGLVEALLNQASTCGDKFSAIGRIGRFFRRRRRHHWMYAKANVPVGRPMNMAGGGEFIVAERLTAALDFRNTLAKAGASPQMLWHDDMILDCGIQKSFEFPPYRVDGGWVDGRRRGKLPSQGYAFSVAPEFRTMRDDLIDLCYQCGWRPVEWTDWKREEGRGWQNAAGSFNGLTKT